VGVKTGGGTLEHVLFKIKVRAFPKDLPEQIVVDVSASTSASRFTSVKFRPSRTLIFSATRKSSSSQWLRQ